MGNSSSQEGGTTSPRDNSESLSPSVSSAPSSEASASIQNHGSVLSPSSSLSSGSGKHHHHHLPHFPRHRPSVNIDTQSPRGPLSSNSPTSPISPALTGTRQDRRGSAGLNTTNFAGSATLNPTKLNSQFLIKQLQLRTKINIYQRLLLPITLGLILALNTWSTSIVLHRTQTTLNTRRCPITAQT